MFESFQPHHAVLRELRFPELTVNDRDVANEPGPLIAGMNVDVYFGSEQ